MKKSLICTVILLALSMTLSAGTYGVYVGYADGIRGGADFPNPFTVGGLFGPYQVSNYFGNACGACDTGAVMVVNTGTTALSVGGLSVNDRANGINYAIWGADFSFTLLPGKAAIFLENAGNNFDSSDFGGNTHANSYAGFDPDTNNCSVGPISLLPSCVNNSPIVTFTVDGASSALFDSGHVLDTGGFDSAAYLHHHSDGTDSLNESLQWRLIGTTGVQDPGGQSPEPATLAMFGTGLVALIGRRYLHRQAKRVS